MYVTLFIQHAMRIRRLMSVVSSLGSPYFCTLSHKLRDFWKKVFDHKIFCFYLELVSENFFILRRIKRDIVNVHGSSCKMPIILVRYQLS